MPSTPPPVYQSIASTVESTIAALDTVDVVLDDLQDIGARYYSYPATAVLLMQEAARRGKPVVVLDRPNPIGGVASQGNLPAAARPVGRGPDFPPPALAPGRTMSDGGGLPNY